MSLLMPKNLNRQALALLCALISLIPVLNYSLAVPDEMLLTMSAWLLSNLVIAAYLWLSSRATRTTRVTA